MQRMHAGICYICSQRTDAGYAQSPSDNFTAWAQLGDGQVFCPRCWGMLRDPQYRRHNWVATPHETEFYPAKERSRLLSRLLHPPEPPYAVYLTRTGQRQGWIALRGQWATTRETLLIAVEWRDRALWVARARIESLLPLAQTVRTVATREEMRTGRYSVKAWEQAIAQGVDLQQAIAVAGEPAWEVICHVV